LPLKRLAELLKPYADGSAKELVQQRSKHPEQAIVTARIAADLVGRLKASSTWVWAT